MIAVVFEVEMRDGRAQDYFDLAAKLRPELDKIDGFISVERFQSMVNERKYVSLSFWRDREAVEAWKVHAEHRAAQQLGKDEIFSNYRIRVAEILHDYGSDNDSASP